MFTRVAKTTTRKCLYDDLLSFLDAKNLLETKILLIGSGPGVSGQLTHVLQNFDQCDIDEARAPDFIWDITKPAPIAKKYDIILCVEVMEHVFDVNSAIDNLLNQLESGGELYISTPFIFEVHDTVDCQRILPQKILIFTDRCEISIRKLNYNWLKVLYCRAASRQNFFKPILLTILPLVIFVGKLISKLTYPDYFWAHSIYILKKR